MSSFTVYSYICVSVVTCSHLQGISVSKCIYWYVCTLYNATNNYPQYMGHPELCSDYLIVIGCKHVICPIHQSLIVCIMHSMAGEGYMVRICGGIT